MVCLFTPMSKIKKVKLKKLELSGVLVCYCFADFAKKMQETNTPASLPLYESLKYIMRHIHPGTEMLD